MTYTGEMVLPRNAVRMTEEEMTYTEGGGFVGLYVTLKKDSLKWTKTAIVGAITGAFAWVLSGLAAFGPAGCIALGIISGIVAVLAADAVSGLKAGKKMAIGLNISGVTLNKSITI